MSDPADYKAAADRRIDRLRDLLGASPITGSAQHPPQSRTPRSAEELVALINADPC